MRLHPQDMIVIEQSRILIKLQFDLDRCWLCSEEMAVAAAAASTASDDTVAIAAAAAATAAASTAEHSRWHSSHFDQTIV